MHAVLSRQNLIYPLFLTVKLDPLKDLKKRRSSTCYSSTCYSSTCYSSIYIRVILARVILVRVILVRVIKRLVSHSQTYAPF